MNILITLPNHPDFSSEYFCGEIQSFVQDLALQELKDIKQAEVVDKITVKKVRVKK